MKKILVLSVTLSLAISFLFSGCVKKDNNPNNSNAGGPTVVLSPANATDIAATIVRIGYTSAAPHGIANIHIEEQFDSHSIRILKDSNTTHNPVVDDEAINYLIPDSGATGQKSVITFRITDTKGNIATKSATVTVLASRPRISVTQNKTTASRGDSVMFNITMKSTEANLGTLTIGQSVNGSSYGTVATLNYTNQSSVNTVWYYKVPFTTSPGDHISLLFTIANKAAVVAVVSKSVDVN